MNADAVAAAVDEVGRALRADGADLVLVDADPKTLRVRVALRLDTVGCADCILAPAALADTIHAALARRLPGEFELLVDDPRPEGTA
ncbi:MAG: NifU family protein [Actinomycetota bacterium]